MKAPESGEINARNRSYEQEGKMDAASQPAHRRWYRRPSRLIPLAVIVALAIGVPLAWATFTDVPPSNPFYADINAIQGAGITSGCGGGNFCPTDNITRQAEAAFVHRAAPRATVLAGADLPIATTGVTDLGSLTITVGGVAGGTQFVVLNATVSTYIQSTTGCPCSIGYLIVDSAFDQVSQEHFNLLTDVAASGFGDETGAASTVVAVPSGTTQTFHVFALTDSGTGTVRGYAEMTATTAAFGGTGGNSLAASVAAKQGRASGPRK